MSSCSSEIDVIRTRIPAYGDDSSVLYAYEPLTAYINNEKDVSDVSSSEEQPKTVMDVLSHCQVIYNAIQDLDKKCDVISGKVSKIHRFRMRSSWQNRKQLGYAYKNYNYLHSKRIKLLKMKKRESPAVFSYPESYSPTTPVERPVNELQNNPVETHFLSDESLEQDPESPHQEQELGLSQSPTASTVFPHSYESYYTHDEQLEGPSLGACFDSPDARNIPGLYSPSRAAGEPLSQEEPGHTVDPGIVAPATYATFTEPGSTAFCIPSSVGSPMGNNTQSQHLPEDPSTWTVEEVIKFLKYTDYQSLAPISNLFREHEIDGKALLLLKSDMMIKYMGLKLGATVKLSHYIEKLKNEKYFDKKKFVNLDWS